MASFEHGSSGYTNHKCRCPVCRAGHAEMVAARRAERRASHPEDNPLLDHGNYNTYINWGCKCAPCRTAHLANNRRYRNRRKE